MTAAITAMLAGRQRGALDASELDRLGLARRSSNWESKPAPQARPAGQAELEAGC